MWRGRKPSPLIIDCFKKVVSDASDGGDPHVKSGCGSNCVRHCLNYNDSPMFCRELCRFNGCDCKNFFFGENTGKCVDPKDCSMFMEMFYFLFRNIY